MSKASLADDEPRDGGDSQDMTSKIYTIIRDYGKRRGSKSILFKTSLVCLPFPLVLVEEASTARGPRPSGALAQK